MLLPERPCLPPGALDVEQNWDNFLPLGEQRWLAFARLLIAAPRFAGLDEALDDYDAVLELAGDGGWVWKSLNEEPARESA